MSICDCQPRQRGLSVRLNTEALVRASPVNLVHVLAVDDDARDNRYRNCARQEYVSSELDCSVFR